MKFWRIFSIALFIAATSLQASAQSLPLTTATPHDIYVSCYLFVRGEGIEISQEKPYSPMLCAAFAVVAIGRREGNVPGETNRFCLPKDASVEADGSRAMAYAYIDMYQDFGWKLKGRSTTGLQAYIAFLAARWPCPG